MVEREDESFATMPSTITVNASENCSPAYEGKRRNLFFLLVSSMLLLLVCVSSSMWASSAPSPLTVIVNVTEDAPTNMVGVAIDILEAKLAKKGIAFQCPESKSNNGNVAQKLLRLPTLIEFVIKHSIANTSTNSATEKSVGFKSTYGKALVPGNVVALYAQGRFLKESDGADFDGDWIPIEALPPAWDSERFLVVDAGNGNIAFYNPSHYHFLGCKNDHLSASGFPITRLNDTPRANECFDIMKVDRSDNKFYLRCPIEKKDVQMGYYSPVEFDVVQVYGFD